MHGQDARATGGTARGAKGYWFMRLQFCGADRTVTGSSHLLEINGLKVFLDMGLYQGSRQEADRLNHYLPDDAQHADAIILSHGHLDHCGKLPVVVKSGFSGPIYCTPATAEVARIVLMDSASIQVEDAQYLNRRGSNPGGETLKPLYTPTDIPKVLSQFRRVAYGQSTDIGNGVRFTFQDAGHILGSAYVQLEWQENGKQRRLLFTGDIGRYHAPILRDPQPPSGPVDFLITESTYGNAKHAPMEEVGPQFLDAVKFCVQRKSRLLLPSFAVGRTQTILWYLQRFIQNKEIPEIPIYVDSPMATEISKITSQFRENYDQPTLDAIGKEDIFGFSRVQFTCSVDESKRINNQSGPTVIIASSPTCEFGRIRHHLTQSIEKPDDLVVFTGYIPGNTLGRKLQEGQKRARILDRWFDVRCQIRTIHGLSAHADGDELLQFLKPALTAQTSAWVVHGEVPQAEGFAQRLLAGGIGRAAVPAMESAVYEDKGDGRADAPTARPTAEVGE
jgi:metallo-beta-lactamase family protein